MATLRPRGRRLHCLRKMAGFTSRKNIPRKLLTSCWPWFPGPCGARGSQLQSTCHGPHLGPWETLPRQGGAEKSMSLSTQSRFLCSFQGLKPCQYNFISLVAPLRFPLARGISAMRRSVKQTLCKEEGSFLFQLMRSCSEYSQVSL